MKNESNGLADFALQYKTTLFDYYCYNIIQYPSCCRVVADSDSIINKLVLLGKSGECDDFVF